MKPTSVAVLLLAPLCAACSGSGLSTGSLGQMLGEEKAASTASAPQIENTPTNRAFQVGSVAARAVKCGYNFDPVRLKSSYLAAEAQGGLTVEDLGKVERVYNVAYTGVAKAIAPQGEYCTPQKTTEIKTALSRHLAGDYTPSAVKPVEQEEGLFSWGSSDTSKSGGPLVKHPMDDR